MAAKEKTLCEKMRDLHDEMADGALKSGLARLIADHCDKAGGIAHTETGDNGPPPGP